LWQQIIILPEIKKESMALTFAILLTQLPNHWVVDNGFVRPQPVHDDVIVVHKMKAKEEAPPGSCLLAAGLHLGGNVPGDIIAAHYCFVDEIVPIGYFLSRLADFRSYLNLLLYCCPSCAYLRHRKTSAACGAIMTFFATRYGWRNCQHHHQNRTGGH